MRRTALFLILIPLIVVALGSAPFYMLFDDLTQVDQTGVIVDTLPYTDTTTSVFVNTFGADSVFITAKRVTNITDKSDSIIGRAFSRDYFGNLTLIDTIFVLDSTEIDTAWLGNDYVRAREVVVELTKQDTTTYDSTWFYYESIGGSR